MTVITKEIKKSKLWGFGYVSYALLFGVSTKTVKRWITAGRFDPSNLESVCELWLQMKRPIEERTYVQVPSGRQHSLIPRLRACSMYLKWKADITNRDKGMCVLCGDAGHHVDHIVGLSDLLNVYSIETYEEALACKALWDSSNGRLVCRKCHADLETTPENLKR